MENATDAIQMAFAVIVFVMALTLAIGMFTQLNQVSKVVLATSDITNFYEYEVATDNTTRIVGLETIIPTLYKYYKENYTVIFLDKDGEPLPLYNSQTDRSLWTPVVSEGNIGKYYAKDKNVSRLTLVNLDKTQRVCAFDVDEERQRREPWTANDFKENLDKFLNGDVFTYPSGATDSLGNPLQYDYGNINTGLGKGGFIGKYSGNKFKETLGQYTYDELDNTDNIVKHKKKRVIIYQLMS